MDSRTCAFIIGFNVVSFIFNGNSSIVLSLDIGPPSVTPGSPSSFTGSPTQPGESASNGTNNDLLGSGFVLGDIKGSNTSLDRLKELHATLLEGYDVTIRPKLNQFETIVVNTTFGLKSIVNFDTTGQSIGVMGYFIITWLDEVIQWNPDEYDGISGIKLPLNRIWYPALVIGKTYDGSKTIGNVNLDRVSISSTGLVQWVPDGIFNFMCEVSVKHYPFDVQTCELIYYVSDESVSSVQINGQKSVLIQEYFNNSEWQLVHTSSRTEEMYHTNLVFLSFQVKRRAHFTVYTMVIPLVTLAVLNTFTFLVPIQSGEKGSLAITLFLAYGFFITITRDALPHNSIQVSYYIVYITILLVLSVFTVMYVIIESKLFFSFGARPFHVCWMLPSKKRKTKKEVSLESVNESLPEKKCGNDKAFTWADAMGHADTIVFVCCGAFVTLLSMILWSMVITGI